VILIDSNVPMYLVGAPHVHKTDAQRPLEKLVTERQRLTTDAQVLQEILHRYVAINRREAIQPAFGLCLESWMKCCRLTGQWRIEQSRSSWPTGNCLLVMVYTSRSCSIMESSELRALIPDSTAFRASRVFRKLTSCIRKFTSCKYS
jgi:predicted nucleic acid-binding protein